MKTRKTLSLAIFILLSSLNLLNSQCNHENCEETSAPDGFILIQKIPDIVLCDGEVLVTVHLIDPDNYIDQFCTVEVLLDDPGENDLFVTELVNIGGGGNWIFINGTQEGDSQFSVVYDQVTNTPEPLMFKIKPSCDLWDLIESGSAGTELLNNSIIVNSAYTEFGGGDDYCLSATSNSFDITYTKVVLEDGNNLVSPLLNNPFDITYDLEISGTDCSDNSSFEVTVEIPSGITFNNATAEIAFADPAFIGGDVPVTVNGNTLIITIDPNNPAFQGFEGFCEEYFDDGMGEATLTLSNLILSECPPSGSHPVIFTIDNCGDGSCATPSSKSTSTTYVSSPANIPGNDGLEITYDPQSAEDLHFCGNEVQLRFTVTNISPSMATNLDVNIAFYQFMNIEKFAVGNSDDYDNNPIGIADFNTDNSNIPACNIVDQFSTNSLYFDFSCSTNPLLGLEDLDGDGEFDDLAAGEFFTIDVWITSGCPFEFDFCATEIEDLPVVEGTVYWKNNASCVSGEETLSRSVADPVLNTLILPGGVDYTNAYACNSSPDLSPDEETPVLICFQESELEGFEDDLFDLGVFEQTLYLDFGELTGVIINDVTLNGVSFLPYLSGGQGVYELDLGAAASAGLTVPGVDEARCFELSLQLDEDCDPATSNGTSDLLFDLKGNWTNCETCEILLGCGIRELYGHCTGFPEGGNWLNDCSVILTESFTAQRTNVNPIDPAGPVNECTAYPCDEVEMVIQGVINTTQNTGLTIIGGFSCERFVAGMDIFTNMTAELEVQGNTINLNYQGPPTSPDPANYGPLEEDVFIYLFGGNISSFISGSPDPIPVTLTITAQVDKETVEAMDLGVQVINDFRGFLGSDAGHNNVGYCTGAGTAEYFGIIHVETIFGMIQPSEAELCNTGGSINSAGYGLGYEGGSVGDDFINEYRPINSYISNLYILIEDEEEDVVEDFFVEYLIYNNGNGVQYIPAFYFPGGDVAHFFDLQNLLIPPEFDKLLYPDFATGLSTVFSGNITCESPGQLFIRYLGTYEDYSYSDDEECVELIDFNEVLPIPIQGGSIETYPLVPEFTTSIGNSSSSGDEPIKINVRAVDTDVDFSWILFEDVNDWLTLESSGQYVSSSGTIGNHKWFEINGPISQFNRELQFDYTIEDCDPPTHELNYYVFKSCMGEEIPPANFTIPTEPSDCYDMGQITINVIPSTVNMEVQVCNAAEDACDLTYFSVLIENPSLGPVYDLNLDVDMSAGFTVAEAFYRYDDVNPLGKYI